MTEPSIDAVPEADLVEQHTPAYPDPADPTESDAELTPLPEGDIGWTASEADLIEQAIPVPLDDEYDEG